MIFPDLQWHAAFTWLCKQRRNAPANADVWDLRRAWPKVCSPLWESIIEGRYRLSPMSLVGRGNARCAMWSARDALVLKWASLQAKPLLPWHTRCRHGSGGGTHRSVHEVASAIRTGNFAFVHRTDIRGYYQNITKDAVLMLINRYIRTLSLCSLLEQYLFYTIEDGGLFKTPSAGISRGCALSPIIAASLLFEVDSDFASLCGSDLFYQRYMDDFVILTRTRWQLRRAVAHLAGYFSATGFERHPDKTFTGRLTKGFDWLGLWFDATGATRISPRSLENHQTRLRTLRERDAKSRTLFESGNGQDAHRYELHWHRWAQSLLQCAQS